MPRYLKITSAQLGPLNLSAVGTSSGKAVALLQAKITARLSGCATIVQLPLPKSSPIPVGSMADNPLFDEWVEAVKEHRRQREAEEEALEAQEN